MLILSLIIPLVSAIIPLGVAIYSKQNTNKLHFINSFTKIYERTISLRSEISKITQAEIKRDFYYEIDIMLCSRTVRETVLDYLTEMENYFSLILNFFVWKTFKILVSLSFYQRLAVLYSFILIQRELTENKELFKNYIKAVEKMSWLPKINNNINNNDTVNFGGLQYGHSQCSADAEIKIHL